ncbi:hypothetical protein VTI74DRAFT_9852 [Chaetomium olivicolor]
MPNSYSLVPSRISAIVVVAANGTPGLRYLWIPTRFEGHVNEDLIPCIDFAYLYGTSTARPPLRFCGSRWQISGEAMAGFPSPGLPKAGHEEPSFPAGPRRADFGRRGFGVQGVRSVRQHARGPLLLFSFFLLGELCPTKPCRLRFLRLLLLIPLLVRFGRG